MTASPAVPSSVDSSASDGGSSGLLIYGSLAVVLVAIILYFYLFSSSGTAEATSPETNPIPSLDDLEVSN